MKFKLDENLGKSVKQIFIDFGHEVDTVYDESLEGSSDEKIYDICKKEARCLVTLDIDFCNILRFPLDGIGGIIVLRPRAKFNIATIHGLIKSFLRILKKHQIINKLWIVEHDRIRVHENKDDDNR